MEEKIRHDSKHEAVSFADLIDLKVWQKIQDNFSNVTKISISTLNPAGEPLCEVTGKPRLCGELIKDFFVTKHHICTLCLPTFLGGKGIVDKNLSFVCIAGLRNFVIPLRLNHRLLGYVLVGPVSLVRLKPKEHYRQEAEELNLDLEVFWDAISEIKVISFHVAQSLIELIKDVAEYSLHLAYQNKMKESEALKPNLIRFSKTLNLLLDVAFQISGADIGSIMLIDKAKNEMSLRASKGIPDEIVKNTRVKVGNGIAGLAAQKGKPMIIDDTTVNNRIKPYLKRPVINSAMVIPIKVKNDTWGVINLATLKESPIRFNEDNVAAINKLLDLSTVVLRE